MFMLAAFILICPAIVAFALAFAVCWKWQRKFTCLQEKMDRLRGKTRAAGGLWAYRWSNRAFDEYRAEMLRRLEEEQRDFLDRLRHAKDKAEFDHFMAEHRNRALSPLRP
jgi:hypothetical protein